MPSGRILRRAFPCLEAHCLGILRAFGSARPTSRGSSGFGRMLGWLACQLEQLDLPGRLDARAGRPDDTSTLFVLMRPCQNSKSHVTPTVGSDIEGSSLVLRPEERQTPTRRCLVALQARASTTLLGVRRRISQKRIKRSTASYV